MNLSDTVKKVFAERKITSLKAFYNEVKRLSKKRPDEEEIEEAIDEYLAEDLVTDIAVDWDKRSIIYRENLFNDTEFKISLTDIEIEEGRMYVGHRFMPFIHPEIPLSDIQLQDEDGNPFTLLKVEVAVSEMYMFVSLLAPYSANIPKIKGQDTAIIEAYDLCDWLKENDFKEKDALRIVPVDYQKHIFRLEKVTSRELATQTFVIQNKDNQLTEAIEDILNWYAEPMPVDMCLFRAYAISKPDLVKEPGTAFGPFISQHEDFTFHNFANFAFIHYNNFEEIMMEEALMENMEQFPIEAGQSKEIDGIFAEMGNSFSELFIVGHAVQQLHKNQAIDKEEILSIIFKNNQPFANSKQAKNFNKAFDQLIKKLEKEWATQRLALPLQRLLTKTLDLKITIVNGLREIDANLVNMEDLDMKALTQLTSFDTLGEQILHFMFQVEDENQRLTPEFATTMLPNVEQMKTNFEEGLEYILSQL
ncbi:MAG: hypothetical protein R3E32_00365 [Chitinophagales bacterium]